jgi:alpha-N-acetylglucosaminidase
MRKFIRLLFFIIITNCISLAGHSADVKAAAEVLISRVIPAHAKSFLVEIIPAENNKDVFEIESGNMGKIILHGNNPVSIASALNWYLKYYCHCQISWCGDNLDLPEKLPTVAKKIHIQSPYRYRVYLNYCTFNYSMAWWDWKRWQQEIDWMAMHGINMVLSVTGQEAVWQNTLRKYGMSDDEIRSFLVGPAYFAWQWMTNIESIFGPLPQQWIDRSVVLEKKIIASERELGMTPILQGFTGYVPIKLMEKQSQAKIMKKPVWFSVGPGTAQLDPLDPLFTKMSRTFLEEQTKLYGTGHVYAADPFHEGQPPKPGSEYLAEVGKTIWENTVAVDSQAIIAMQTWSLREPIVKAIPNDKILLLDLNASKWKGTSAFWRRPWVAGIIHNFGGNTAMGGDLDAVLKRFPALLNEPEKTKQLEGIGMFSEAIIQNPVIYEAASEMAWYTQKPDTKTWLTNYVKARYGSINTPVQSAWDTLLHTVYGKRVGIVTFRESAICARPALKVNGASPNGSLNSEKNYPFSHLWKAVELLQQATPSIKKTDTYKYDFVDAMRQCLADLAIPMQVQMANAYRNNKPDSFTIYSNRFLDLMDDMNTLLGSREEFLLGKWIADARAIGVTKAEEEDLYEKNARPLITTWGPYNDHAIQYDYSARQWNGMIQDFYKPRWQMFIHFLKGELKKDTAIRYKEININNRFGRPSNTANEFYNKMAHWEAAWSNTHDASLLTKPTGNEIQLVQKFYKKWLPESRELEKE